MCANVCVCLFAKHLRWLYDFIDFLFIHEMWIRWNEALSKHLTSLCSSFSSDFDWFAKQNIHISTTSTVYTIYIEKESSLSTFVVFIYLFFLEACWRKHLIFTFVKTFDLRFYCRISWWWVLVCEKKFVITVAAPAASVASMGTNIYIFRISLDK